MMNNSISRRKILQAGISLSAISAAMFTGLVRADWPALAYQQKSLQGAMSELYGKRQVEDSSHVSLKAPELAENGAVVPIKVDTDLPKVKSISIFVENNPNPLAARFNMGATQKGKIATRIKIAKQSKVTAVVETETGLFKKTHFIKVTRGGCGG